MSAIGIIFADAGVASSDSATVERESGRIFITSREVVKCGKLRLVEEKYILDLRYTSENTFGKIEKFLVSLWS
jgi:hypothetical protein